MPGLGQTLRQRPAAVRLLRVTVPVDEFLTAGGTAIARCIQAPSSLEFSKRF